MTESCMSVCTRFSTYQKGWSALMFKEGKKYCATCEYRIETGQLRCNCCHKKYRLGPLSKHRDWSAIYARKKLEGAVA